jgi:3-hydroxyacyl-CoA dehydrogenase
MVSVTKDGDIGIITINNPPVNALSPGVPEGIGAGLEELQKDPAVRGIVLIGAGRTFCAGADIKEFIKITSGQTQRGLSLHGVLQALDDCSKPVVCAIHGTAFGGGLELAMACHYRVASADAKVGQPEVKLGIIPGAGGTQRLPRLAGMARAAEMCAGGEPIGAAEAASLGILDKIIDGDLRQGGVAFAREVAARGGKPRRTRDRTDKLGDPKANAAALAAVREQVQKRARGMLAPVKAIEAVEAAAVLPFDAGCQKEAELFRECLFSDQSKALIHVFFSERETSKVPGITPQTPRINIQRAAVVGAGTMGGGIAMSYANAGIPVILKEVSQEALDRGLATIQRNYATTMQKGRLSQQQMDERLARIQPTLTYDRFGEADIVVEAVFEGMALKKQVFAELEMVTRPDAILASNTSTLDIDQIASATARPQRVIGHHFFSPANVMRLIEIVRGKQSGPEVIATSLDLARRLGKVGILVGNGRGFVGNRMFEPYMREAQFLVEEGARIEEVDGALTAFGMAMGPLAVADLAGIDVGWRIRQEYKHLTPEGQRVPVVADRLYERGYYGQKTGAGWYRYEAGSRAPKPNPVAAQLAEECARSLGTRRRVIGREEVLERTLYTLINEGAHVLEEGLALRASDIDIMYINGYGFPAFRGGPMWYGDSVGLPKVYDAVCRLHQQHGEVWAPAPLLKQLAASGKTFADLDREKAGSR